MEIHQRTGKLTAPYQHLVRYSQGDQVILNKTGDLTIFIRNKLDLHTECNYEYLYGVLWGNFPVNSTDSLFGRENHNCIQSVYNLKNSKKRFRQYSPLFQ